VSMAKRYTVRKQTSGWTHSESWDVYCGAKRVSYDKYLWRQDAQRYADQLTINDMVPDYRDDPRPYEVRRAEAETKFSIVTQRRGDGPGR
jgi:hypothetical protein